MADRVAVAKLAAKESFEAMSRQDQQALDRIVRNLCEDPTIAAPLKVKFDVPPAVVNLYNDLDYWVVYHLPDNRTVEVWNVGKGDPPINPLAR
jgi:hypothetical protein